MARPTSPLSLDKTIRSRRRSVSLSALTGVLTIDLDALVANWRKLESRCVPAECAAVVKADAYGCGLPPVVAALAAAGCKTFFVATLERGARAPARRRRPRPIYVLDGYFGRQRRTSSPTSTARPVIGDLARARRMGRASARRTGLPGSAAIHIDTGMNRLGLRPR